MRNSVKIVRLEYLKWIQSFKIALSKELQYKVHFLCTMTIPVGVFFFIKYNLWYSIYSINSYQQVQGYTLDEMIEYQFWILIIEIFSRSHYFSENIGSDIRLGKISSFLIYPFGFINYKLSVFCAQKSIQLFVGIISLALALCFSWVCSPLISILLKAGLFILTINIFWFITQIMVGFLSFWLEETWSLNASIRFMAIFLSGAIIPLEFYPEWLSKVLLWTPFPYITYIPVKILMNEYTNAWSALFVLLIWIFILLLLANWLWRKGLKHYTGAGI